MSNMLVKPMQINSPAHLVGIIQSLATGSFDRKFSNQDMTSVVNAFAFVTQDLTQNQINQGLATLLEMKYAPDAVMFRGWCLGQKTIEHSDAIADSYVGKNGALANIKAWINDDTQPISIAEKQAYDKTMHMFKEAEQSNNQEYAKSQAYSAFKDAYEFIVRELVKNKQMCQPYIVPSALVYKKPKPKPHNPANKEMSDKFYQRFKAGEFSKPNNNLVN